MAHEVTEMFFVGETPWHRLGKEMPAEITCLAAMSIAGLDWIVDMERIYTQHGLVEDFRAVVRQGDMPDAATVEARLGRGYVAPERHLGVMSSTWTPIQNHEIAAIGDAIAGEGAAACHTAGSLQGGKWIWFCLKLDKLVRIKGDPEPIEPYMVLSNWHGEPRSAVLAMTPIRPVCANTLGWGLSSASSTIKIRHTANVSQRLDMASKAMGSARDWYERFELLANKLVDTPFSTDQMTELAAHLLPAPKTTTVDALALLEQVKQEREAERTDAIDAISDALKEKGITPALKEKREKLVTLFETGTGIEGPLRGTAYAATQAVSEFTDHGRDFVDTKRYSAAENHFANTLFGDGAKLQQKALDRIAEMVQL